MAIRRANGAEKSGGSGGSLVGGDAAALFPTLWEWLSSEQYDDASARQTATMLVFVEDGSVKLCLNDRDSHRKAWVTGKTPEAAFASLEQALASDTADWRADKGGPRKGR
jgi:hypothetical protein